MEQTPPQFGAGWWDGQRRGGIGSTFSDDANTANEGRSVTSPSSYFIARSSCICGRSPIDEPATYRWSLLKKVPSYRRCDDAALLKRLGSIQSSAEITSCMRICQKRVSWP
jgi:hypothetical protein